MSDMKNEKEVKTNVEILAEVSEQPIETIQLHLDSKNWLLKNHAIFTANQALTAMDKVREQMQGRMEQADNIVRMLANAEDADGFNLATEAALAYTSKNPK